MRRWQFPTSLVSGQREISLLTVRPDRVLTLAGPEVGAEKMRLRLPIRGPRLSSVPGRNAVARWSGRRRLRQRHSSAEGGTRRSRKSGGAIPRGEFRPCVPVAARQLEHFEPGAHVAARHLLLAAAPKEYERKPISGVQRRRRPDRQACVAHIAPRSRRR